MLSEVFEQGCNPDGQRRARSRKRLVSIRLSKDRSWALALCLGVSLSSAQAMEQPTGQIQVTADGHFLMQANGEPFFWLADTAWELFHGLDRSETEQYLQDRAQKGFTVVQAVA